MMKFFLILLFPFLAQADYRIGFGTGAYMGRHQIQAERLSENQKHHALGIFGFTQDQEIGDIKQIAAIYLFDVFEQNDFDQLKWTPLLAGGFMTYTDHRKYYITSPSKYKNDAYYDMTGLRFGLRFGTELVVVRKSGQALRFILDGSLLERALIAFANNPSEYQIFQAFWSLGLSVRFDF